MSTSKKNKLTITVDKDVIEAAKEVSKEKNIPLSRAIENFLEFFTKPEVYCFECGEKFDATKADVCPKCGWLICPECKACRCKLGDETATAIFHMRKVYEDLLGGRIK
jgi:hypothetical protein